MKLCLSQEKKSHYEYCMLAGLFLLGHFSQIQQGSGIDALKSSTNFYHLIVFTREVFPENFSFIINSVSFYSYLKFAVRDCLWFANLFDFQGLLLSDSFGC